VKRISWIGLRAQLFKLASHLFEVRILGSMKSGRVASLHTRLISEQPSGLRIFHAEGVNRVCERSEPPGLTIHQNCTPDGVQGV
jgi:hypothetical protein